MHRTLHPALIATVAAFGLAACAASEEPALDFAAGGDPTIPPAGAVQGRFEETPESGWVDAAESPLSTFSVDTDTASYTVARRSLQSGSRPDPASVRVEEYLNFFRYDYPAPGPEDDAPFAVHLEGAPSPFGEEGTHLLRVALKGREVPAEDRSPANLVFLVDVSGSMHSSDKLGLVQFSLARLLDGLMPDDTVAIVTYAGADAVILRPTPVAQRGLILEAIDDFRAGGSTNGAAGIETAYALAEEAFREEGINRVVLCTDGDFNVGRTGEDLVRLVESWRDRSIYLTVLGYGTGNLDDAFIEQLTNRADGQYAYVDSRNEALRVLGERLVGTLEVIARDVKVQVEFDAAAVRRYRLIGYDNRLLDADDFRDDSVDAGEIGSGHAVTALYEVELTGEGGDPATVRVRYAPPHGGDVSEIERPLAARAVGDDFAMASPDLRFAAAVAEFGEILRGSRFSEGERFADIVDIARSTDVSPGSDRAEFIELVESAAGR